MKKLSDLGYCFATKLLKKTLIRILNLNDFELNLFILKENIIFLLDKSIVIEYILNSGLGFLKSYIKDIPRKELEVGIDVNKEIDNSFLSFFKSVYQISKARLKRIIYIMLKEDWGPDLYCVNIPLYYISLIDSDFLDEILINFISTNHENLLPLITDTCFLSNLSVKAKDKVLEFCSQHKLF